MKRTSLLAWGSLLLLLLALAPPATAAGNLDVWMYDGTGCSGTAFRATHEYNDLRSVGWSDRISGYDTNSGGVAGTLWRDENWTGEHKNFGATGVDCDLSNNEMSWPWSWSNQATSISQQ